VEPGESPEAALVREICEELPAGHGAARRGRSKAARWAGSRPRRWPASRCRHSIIRSPGRSANFLPEG
jgi:hypothetical protein